MQPTRLGILGCGAAAVMLATELLWRPVFTIAFTESLHLRLWMLFALYGVLQLYVGWATKRSLDLSNKELERWGELLEAATPEILADYESGKQVKEIATLLEEREGVPQDVTVRYIVALARHGRDTASD